MTKTRNVVPVIIAIVAVGFASLSAARATAQCCGGGGAVAYYQPTTAYYAPTAYTAAYAPTTYQTYRPMFGGWYPGKLLGQINRRIWGVPETYAAAYPTTYAAAYPAASVAAYPSASYTAAYPAAYTASYPTYTASYAPSYSASYATTTAYAAPAACPTCVPACTTCAMPACDPCAACAASTPAVTQATYVQPADCPTCAPTYSQSTPQQAPPSSTPPQTYGGQTSPDPAPGLDPGANVPQQREEVQRQPMNNGNDASVATDDLKPIPENQGTEGAEGSSTSFEAPPLFLNPQDRTAQRSPAPVRTAVLHRSASQVAPVAAPISWQQAQQDAAGWVSASE